MIISLMLAITLAGCNSTGKSDKEEVQLLVSAAASLTDALTEIQKAYEAEHSNVTLQFNFGASGALQQQIEQGADADLFLSAATKNMNALVEKQLIDAGEKSNLLLNELVVVVPANRAIELQDISALKDAAFAQIAIGIPASVPAGQYAQEALTKAELWDAVKDKTVQAKDVRQVLQYVETGNVDAGFVYTTDALSTDQVHIAMAVDPSTYTPVEYPIGIVKTTKHKEEAKRFYDYLHSDKAMDVFVKYGFKAAE